jgi:hypothetical protein
MNQTDKQRWIKEMTARGWHLATHMTLADRRAAAHRFIGPLHFMKPRTPAPRQASPTTHQKGGEK